MDAVRLRPRFGFGPVLEWLAAAAMLAATFGVGAMILAELRPGPVPAAATEQPAIASIPPAVPERAVSVPILPFLDGKDVRIGESFSAVAARLGRAAESGRQEVDRGSLGERLTRFYDYAGSRFILVFEPFERNGEARVAAIYLP